MLITRVGDQKLAYVNVLKTVSEHSGLYLFNFQQEFANFTLPCEGASSDLRTLTTVLFLPCGVCSDWNQKFRREDMLRLFSYFNKFMKSFMFHYSSASLLLFVLCSVVLPKIHYIIAHCFATNVGRVI